MIILFMLFFKLY